MTLKDDLVDYFNKNQDQAAQAMCEELNGFWGWGSQKDVYTPSDFEGWATPLGIKAELATHHGGGGQGDQYYAVYKFTDEYETVYIKFSGWYASYNGAEYQDFSVVTPKEKTVVVYD